MSAIFSNVSSFTNPTRQYFEHLATGKRIGSAVPFGSSQSTTSLAGCVPLHVQRKMARVAKVVVAHRRASNNFESGWHLFVPVIHGRRKALGFCLVVAGCPCGCGFAVVIAGLVKAERFARQLIGQRNAVLNA